MMALLAISCEQDSLETMELQDSMESMELDQVDSSAFSKASENSSYGYISFSSAMASNGHSLEVFTDNYPSYFESGDIGDNWLSIHAKSVHGSGTFTHKDADSNMLAMGTWSATKLLSFKNYGPSPASWFPFPDGRAGFANIRIHLIADGGWEFDAILRIRCLLPQNSSTPPSWVEGIRISVEDGLDFSKTIPGGGTLFIAL